MKKYKQNLKKKDSVNTQLSPPKYFLHTGNYALNKLMSGGLKGGSPQGRLVAFAGHSSSGKSLVAASHVAEVIKNGGYAFVIDSETALDDKFMSDCGVDVENENYQYIGVDGINSATREVNEILKMYRDEGEETQGLIVVDSLDMLLTETEQTRLDKSGDIGGDQGQQAKQLKAMLKTWVHSITNLPITIICTKQVYVEQDPIKAYEEPWKFTESLKFAFSQIIVFEKLQYREQESGKKVHKGFTLKAKSYKNRFANEKQIVKVEIPFDHGVSPYSGLIEIAEQYGVISKNGAWYTPETFEGKKFQQKAAESNDEFMQELLSEVMKEDDKHKEVYAALDDYVGELESPSSEEDVKESLKKKKEKNAAKKSKKDEDTDE